MQSSAECQASGAVYCCTGSMLDCLCIRAFDPKAKEEGEIVDYEQGVPLDRIATEQRFRDSTGYRVCATQVAKRK